MIISARQKGKALCDLSQDEFDAAVTGIIFNVSVICGCQLPTHEAHINALEKEFTIFLMDFGYHNHTPEEILTAFRMNANFQLHKKVEMYGALFNIDFAAQVLEQYRNKRFVIDERLGLRFVEIERDKIFEEEDNNRRKNIVKQFGLFCDGKISEMDLSNCYMQLAQDGAFLNQNSLPTFWENKKQTEDEQSITTVLRNYNQDLDRMFDTQKGIVLYLFEQMKKTGRLKIYDENLKLAHPGFEVPEPEKEKEG